MWRLRRACDNAAPDFGLSYPTLVGQPTEFHCSQNASARNTRAAIPCFAALSWLQRAHSTQGRSRQIELPCHARLELEAVSGRWQLVCLMQLWPIRSTEMEAISGRAALVCDMSCALLAFVKTCGILLCAEHVFIQSKHHTLIKIHRYHTW